MVGVLVGCEYNLYEYIMKVSWSDNPNIIVSPDESRGYLGFSTVTPPPPPPPLPPQRFPFGRDNLKNMPQTLLFVTLTFNLKVTGGHLKVRFWPFLHILAQFSKTES